MLDTRKVQTAVLGSAESQRPVFLPFDRTAALRLRDLYQYKSFHCGVWLGGCGRRLHTRIGRERIPHFAHDPEHDGALAACRRVESDERSADHLYIRSALPRWLRDQGLVPGPVTLEGSIPGEGGVCTGVLTPADGGTLIAVALRDDPSHGGFRGWPARDAELRATHPDLIWLFGESTSLAHHLIDRQGYAFRIRCQESGDTRRVQIGTQIGSTATHWADLSECAHTREGLRTPHSREAGSLTLRPSRGNPAEPRVPDVRHAAPEVPQPAIPLAVSREQATMLEILNALSSARTDHELDPSSIWRLREQAESVLSSLSFADRSWARAALNAHDRWLRGIPKPASSGEALSAESSLAQELRSILKAGERAVLRNDTAKAKYCLDQSLLQLRKATRSEAEEFAPNVQRLANRLKNLYERRAAADDECQQAVEAFLREAHEATDVKKARALFTKALRQSRRLSSAQAKSNTERRIQNAHQAWLDARVRGRRAAKKQR